MSLIIEVTLAPTIWSSGFITENKLSIATTHAHYDNRCGACEIGESARMNGQLRRGFQVVQSLTVTLLHWILRLVQRRPQWEGGGGGEGEEGIRIYLKRLGSRERRNDCRLFSTRTLADTPTSGSHDVT